MRRVSWNDNHNLPLLVQPVTPRMRRVSWNLAQYRSCPRPRVTPRMRRVSWNSSSACKYTSWYGHASHEACELKLSISFCTKIFTQSRLAWGVWVEIYNKRYFIVIAYGHASHEACELKSIAGKRFTTPTGHASHEACELKYTKFVIRKRNNRSRLAWGVWVEIWCCNRARNSLRGHASHEACELKLMFFWISEFLLRHASHEACELKSSWVATRYARPFVTPRMRRVSWNGYIGILFSVVFGHASHEACELK